MNKICNYKFLLFWLIFTILFYGISFLFIDFKISISTTYFIIVLSFSILQILRYFLINSKDKLRYIIVTSLFTLIRLIPLFILTSDNLLVNIFYIIITNILYSLVIYKGYWYTPLILVLILEFIPYVLGIGANLWILTIIYTLLIGHLFRSLKKTYLMDSLLLSVVGSITIIILIVLGVTKYHMIAIISTSMYDTIKKGDAIIYKELNNDEKANLKVEDIIAYEHEDYLVVHRIIEIDKLENKIITKGDNNSKEDDWVVSKEEIVGKYCFNIPVIGVPSVWLREKVS